MSVCRNLIRSIPAAALAATLATGLVSLAGAQGMGAAEFKQYHGAIRAYELCNDVTFSQAEYGALSRAIDERTQVNLSVGQGLSVIEEAQSEAWDLVFKNQCDSAEVQQLLTLFQSDLAPALS